MDKELVPAKVRLSDRLGLAPERDLVVKLRTAAPQMGHYGAWAGGVLLEQAADEIERLREHAVILAETAEQVERERCAVLVESRASVRGTRALVALTAAADAIRGA